MNEEDRKRIIKQIEREILFAHLNGTLPPNFNKTLSILRTMNIDPDALLDNAFYKFDLLSILCKSGEAEPVPFKNIDFSQTTIFDITTHSKIQDIPTKDFIPFTVSGDSMVGAGINDGDILLVKKEFFEDGATYVVKFEDTFFVKKVERTSNGYRLISANPNYQDVVIRDEFDLEIIGKVKYILKKL